MLTVSASNLHYCEFGEKSERLCASCISKGGTKETGCLRARSLNLVPLLSPGLSRPLSSGIEGVLTLIIPCSRYAPGVGGLFVLFPGPVLAASTLTLGWANVIFFSCLNRHSMNCLSNLFNGLKLNDIIEKHATLCLEPTQQRALMSLPHHRVFVWLP